MAEAASARQPRVSVLMAAFNAGRFLAESIESVLRQTYPDWELVILDDGSTDATAEIARSYADPRIRCVANARNMGLVYTRNRMVSLATGTYVAVLDSDDIAYPTRLEREVRFLDDHPEHGLVGSAVDIVDAEGRHTGARWPRFAEDSEIPARLFFGNAFAHSTVMMRRSVLPDPAYRAGYAPAEDYDLWIRLSQVCCVHNFAEPLVAYRKHANNVSFAVDSGLARAERQIMHENACRMVGASVSEHDAALLHRLFHRYALESLEAADVDRLLSLLGALGDGFPGAWKHVNRATFHRILLENALELQKLRKRGPATGLAATLLAPIGSPFDRLSFVSDELRSTLRRKALRVVRR